MSLLSNSNGFIREKSKRRFNPKFTFKIILVLVLAILITGVGSQLFINKSRDKKLVKNNTYVNINEKKNYYSMEGTEKPTIIFESSSGMGIAQWHKTRELLKDEFGIESFAYDRQGFGMSEYAGEESIEEQAKKLKLLLRKVASTGPYILVGEGYGSLVMTNFAKLYPELVSGIILISPINEAELGNTNYYNYFKEDKLSSKAKIYGSYLGLNNLTDKIIGFDTPNGLENYLSEEEYNNYKLLRTSTAYNKAYYAEIENILSKSSKSQMDGMFNDIPYVIVTSNDYKKEQEELKSLGNKDLTKVIDSNSNSEIISLEKPELILNSVKFILSNQKVKESSNY